MEYAHTKMKIGGTYARGYKTMTQKTNVFVIKTVKRDSYLLLSGGYGGEDELSSKKYVIKQIYRRGDFTTYLFKNHKLEYNKNWNDEVREIKEKYIPMISEKVSIALTNNGMLSNILNDINMNILSIFMLEYYSESYSCDFYNKMLEIYLAGHLPCGWAGEYPNGKFVVY